MDSNFVTEVGDPMQMHLVVGAANDSTGLKLLYTGIFAQLIAHAALYGIGLNGWNGMNLVVVMESLLEATPGFYGVCAFFAERFDIWWEGDNPIDDDVMHL